VLDSFNMQGNLLHVNHYKIIRLYIIQTHTMEVELFAEGQQLITETRGSYARKHDSHREISAESSLIQLFTDHSFNRLHGILQRFSIIFLYEGVSNGSQCVPDQVTASLGKSW